MTGFFTRQIQSIVSAALTPVETAGRRFADMCISMAGLAGVAAACLIAALIFLSIALDLWIAQLAGPVVAALAAAGLYLLVALICFVLLLRARRAKPSVKTKGRPRQAAEKGAEGEDLSSDFSASVEEAVAPFVAVLQQTGLKREEVALRFAAEASKQIGPLILVGLALAVGFLFERSLNKSNPAE